MLVGFGSTNEAFRDRTAAMPPIVLRRKKCACGLESTAKQLHQYGKCVRCVKDGALRAQKAAA